jgi:hypothetical protein
LKEFRAHPDPARSSAIAACHVEPANARQQAEGLHLDEDSTAPGLTDAVS